MKNIEYLQSMDICDMLIMIAKNAEECDKCPLALVEGKFPFMDIYCDVQENCKSCLHDWLNEERE